jgi:hypothetical protein
MSLADSSYPLLNAIWTMFEFCGHDGQVGHRWTVMLWRQPTRFVAAGRKAAIPAPLSAAAVPNFSGLGRIAMSAPSLKPDQPSRPYPSGRYAPGRSTRHKLGKPAGALALITGGLAGLIIGIGIGNAARKRIDKWVYGYPEVSQF